MSEKLVVMVPMSRAKLLELVRRLGDAGMTRGELIAAVLEHRLGFEGSE
jgi:hypothetical protein